MIPPRSLPGELPSIPPKKVQARMTKMTLQQPYEVLHCEGAAEAALRGFPTLHTSPYLLPLGFSLLISWLQSPSAVTLEPPKIKSAIVSTVSPSISHEVMGPDAMILVF